jgi:hypothetical protein
LPVSGSTGYRSGFTTLPPRVILAQNDSMLGAYPPHLRTGDKDFTGHQRVIFDDRTAILYLSNSVTTQYPMVLPTSYPSTYKIVATPNIVNDVLISRSVPKGPGEDALKLSRILFAAKNADAREYHSSLVMENITPFDESRINLGSGSFYMTGTDPSVVPGFATPLKNKTQIVIDINPSTATDVYFSTGSLEPGCAAACGIVYYNFNSTQWEDIYDASRGSIDILASDAATRHSGYMAFAGSNAAGVGSLITAPPPSGTINQFVGSPTANFGFPFSSRYDPTSNQALPLKGIIKHPFLLEKVTIEFSASFGPTYMPRAGGIGPVIKNFFLMNVMTFNSQSLPPASFQEQTRNTGSFSYSIGIGSRKELVTYGMISMNRHSWSGGLGGMPSSWARDLTIDLPGPPGSGAGTTAFRGPVTGSYKLEFPCRTPNKPETSGLHMYVYRHRTTSVSNYSVNNLANETIGYRFGGRDGYGRPPSRALVRGTIGSRISGSTTTGYNWFLGTGTKFPVYSGSDETSPYILLPSDNLVLGFANTPDYLRFTQYGGVAFDGINADARGERALALSRTTLAPGIGKVTLYGCLLKDAKEFHFGSNQPLTSDAIHEDVSSGIPTLDQFQVDPPEVFMGNYLDDIISGSFFKNTRRVVARSTAGTQGITGSLFRGVRLLDMSEQYYDTMLPSLGDLNKKVTFTSSKLNPQQSRLGYSLYFFSGALLTPPAGNLTAFVPGASYPYPFVGNPTRLVDETVGFILSGNVGLTQYEYTTNYEDIKKMVFKFGESLTVNTFTQAKVAGTQVYRDSKFSGGRGFLYGIKNIIPQKTAAIFRYNSYGQFRDMLETREDTQFYDVNYAGSKIKNPAVIIKFVNQNNEIVKPRQTTSQNLSKFATSSLPYFDGVAVDRPDDPQQSSTIVITEVVEV